MLPKPNRLPRKEFKQVKRKGKLVQSSLFGTLIHKRASIHQTSPPRIGFIVSSKVAKKAVLRNKLKRLLREATRSHINSLSSGYDLVFLAKKTLINTSPKDASLEIDHIFKTIAHQPKSQNENPIPKTN